jgi:hypothetical protein
MTAINYHGRNRAVAPDPVAAWELRQGDIDPAAVAPSPLIVPAPGENRVHSCQDPTTRKHCPHYAACASAVAAYAPLRCERDDDDVLHPPNPHSTPDFRAAMLDYMRQQDAPQTI